MPDTPLIAILSFDPLRLELPTAAELAGEVQVQLPPVHVNLIDLSLGGLLPDRPHIGADLPMTKVSIKLSEPATVGNLVDLIAGRIDIWRDLWRASQRALDKCGPLLG